MPIAHEMYFAESTTTDLNRPAVVLVHGAGYDHSCWPMEMRRLAGWRVLAVDLPGHGRSINRPRQSVAAYARDLADFLNELGDEFRYPSNDGYCFQFPTEKLLGLNESKDASITRQLS